MEIISIFLMVMGIYLACGFLFMIPFVIKGINAIDEGAHGSSIGFRIIIIPGAVIFWPVLLRKWIKQKSVNQRSQEDSNSIKFKN